MAERFDSPAGTGPDTLAATKPRRTAIWTRPWLPYLLLLIVGMVAGFAYAVSSVRAGATSSDERIGAWQTGRDFGTIGQSAMSRAVVARHGLLALPAAEARYYTATVDDGGQPLVANCAYRITGGRMAAQFWTVTAYDQDGHLIANDANAYSFGSAAMSPAEQGRWTILVSADPQPGRWLATGGGTDPFALTLRAYLPADGGRGNFAAAQLPSIRKEACK